MAVGAPVRRNVPRIKSPIADPENQNLQHAWSCDG